MKLMQKLFLIIGLFVGCATLAQAHAFLDHAEPKVGGTNKGSPSLVKVWFTEGLEEGASNLQVFDAKGTEVDKKDVKVNGATMTVSVPKLGPGAYKVVWSVICSCECQHHTNGTFTFTVAAP
jgi:hypothetical protein